MDVITKLQHKMNTKTFSLTLSALLVAVLLVSLTSALTATTPAQLTIANNQSSFTITNDQSYNQTILISFSTTLKSASVVTSFPLRSLARSTVKQSAKGSLHTSSGPTIGGKSIFRI